MLEATSATMRGATACAATSRRTPTATPSPTTSGARSSAAAAKPIGAIAHDFTRQPGVPLVRVERSDCTDGETTLELRRASSAADRPGKKPLRWRVPVIARAGGHAPVRTLVAGGKAGLVVPGCGLVVVNAGQSGYYRTAYAPTQQAAIRDAFARLDAIDQVGLVDDMWALGLAGIAPIGDALELVARTPADAAPKLWAGSPSTCAASTPSTVATRCASRTGAPTRAARWRRCWRGSAGRSAPASPSP